MVNCFMGLVFIAGVWLNPCAVIYMESSKKEECKVRTMSTINYLNLSCEEIIAAFDMKRK